MMQNSFNEPVDGATDNLSDREYINKGLNFWLNNKPKESEIFFKRRSDRTSVLAGYSFILCMVLKFKFIWNLSKTSTETVFSSLFIEWSDFLRNG